MNRNIVLVGFPGAGKTTIGQELATQLNLRFVDLDEAVEDKYHATIPHIFEKYGEFVFRQCERSTLEMLLPQSDLLIATGGGTPCNAESMRLIKERCFSIYWKLPENILLDRLRNSHKQRPLIRGLSKDELAAYIHDTLLERAPFYEQANLIVDGEHFDFAMVVSKIREHSL